MGSMAIDKKKRKTISPPVVHRLLRVVRLKHAPIRREGPDREVVLLLLWWLLECIERERERRERKDDRNFVDRAESVVVFSSPTLLLRLRSRGTLRRTPLPMPDIARSLTENENGAARVQKEGKLSKKREREERVFLFLFSSCDDAFLSTSTSTFTIIALFFPLLFQLV